MDRELAPNGEVIQAKEIIKAGEQHIDKTKEILAALGVEYKQEESE